MRLYFTIPCQQGECLSDVYKVYEDGTWKNRQPIKHTQVHTDTHPHAYTHTADSANKCPFILDLNCHDSFSHTASPFLIL